MSELNTHPNHGLLLGWQQPRSRLSFREPLWDESGEGHLMTIAPTGAGKGVSCAIPALLTWQGPCIVVDPKGEHYAVTARRRRELGQRVRVIDPFGITSVETDALNPLDLMEGPDDVDSAAVIASLIVQGRISLNDPYWDERSKSLITDAITFAVKEPHLFDGTLGDIHRLIRYVSRASDYTFISAMKSPIEVLASTFNPPGYAMDKTRACIMSSACSHLSFISQGPVAASLRRSTISLTDVKDGAPMTIYLVLPPDKFESHGRLIRLWMGTLLTALSRRRRAPLLPTLLLFDEAAQFGRMSQLSTALTLLRSYGVRVWTFWQDLSQLRAAYPEAETLLNNSAILQQFGVSTPLAAANIEAYYGAYLPKPVYDLAGHEMVLSRAGLRPQLIGRASYLADPVFQGLYDENPLHLPAPPVFTPDVSQEPPSPRPVQAVLPFRAR